MNCEEKLIKYSKEHIDILKVIIGTNNNNKTILIIIMEDSTNDNVLEYNDFCFKLRDQFSEFYDFMVLDIDMISFVSSYLSNIKIIYNAENSCN